MRYAAWMLGFVLAALAIRVDAQDADDHECSIPQPIESLSLQELWWRIDEPGCDAVEIAKALDRKLPVRPSAPDFLFFRHRTAVDEILLGDALAREDRSASRELAQRLLDHELRWDEDYQSKWRYIPSKRAPDIERWAGVLVVLDGEARPPDLPAITAPTNEWTVHYGFCGTSAMRFVNEAGRVGVADAWAALGRHDLAVQHVLATQWVEAMAYAESPPRLRELATRALGQQGRYEQAVEAALATIRVDALPGGRVATMQLFGVTLPLPVATQGYEEPAKTFRTKADIAGYGRRRLLADCEAQ